jgi:hypothetical protein
VAFTECAILSMSLERFSNSILIDFKEEPIRSFGSIMDVLVL